MAAPLKLVPTKSAPNGATQPITVAPLASSATAAITSIETATQAILALDRDRMGMLQNRAYLERGDHWQNGDAWGGPPVPDLMEGADETMQALSRDQAPIPVLEEIAGRLVTGLVGREPVLEVVAKRILKDGEELQEEEQADLGELNEALRIIWDDNGGMDTLHQFTYNLTSGRATLRFMLPPERAAALQEAQERGTGPVLLQDGAGGLIRGGAGTPKALSGGGGVERPTTQEAQARALTEAAAHLFLEAPDWESAGVLLNRKAMSRKGVFVYQASEGVGEDAKPLQRVEITQVLPGGLTQFLVLQEGQTEAEAKETARVYDSGGLPWVFQSTTRAPLIGPSQRALQRKIDFLDFLLPKNAQYAGFRERHFINVKQEKDATGALKTPELGPGKVAFWQPVTYTDGEGNEHAAPASLILTEPVDSGPIREDINHLIMVLLKSCSQLHTVISGDATVSGASRVQARAEFAESLLATKPKVEKPLRECLYAALCLACHLSGREELLARLKKDYRVRVDCKPNAGPLSADERRVLLEEMEKGVRSVETTMMLLGIEDVDDELNKLKAEAQAKNEALLSDGF